MTFELTWEGNYGTFKSASSVVLPLNQPVDLSVEIPVTSPGARSAILNLDHPSVAGHAHRLLAAVVAAYRFSAADRYKVNAELTVPRPGDRPVFVEVPAGAAALVFSAHAEDGQAYLAVISSDREYLYPGAFNAPAEQVGVVTNPEPGVWEINVCTSWEVCEYKPSRPRPVKPTKVMVTARIVGGAITTSLWARVSGISEPGADLDIYLIDCSTPPAAPGPVPPGGTRDSYLDLFTHPKFGILAVTDHSDKRESGAGWTAAAQAWAASRPDGPRTLMGRILMRSAEFMLSDGSPAVVGGVDLRLDFLRPKK